MSEISPVAYFVGLKADDIVIAGHLSLPDSPHWRPMKSLVTAVLSPFTAFSEKRNEPEDVAYRLKPWAGSQKNASSISTGNELSAVTIVKNNSPHFAPVGFPPGINAVTLRAKVSAKMTLHV